MQIRVKKLVTEAVLPQNANEEDAGYDLVALDDGVINEKNGYLEYKTGIAIAPPKGYHTEIFPRSSISKYDLVLANSIGLVDQSYRGEVLVRFKVVLRFAKNEVSTHTETGYINFGIVKYTLPGDPVVYKKGDKIAQLVIRKTERAEFIESDTLDVTMRGSGGFGSTGA